MAFDLKCGDSTRKAVRLIVNKQLESALEFCAGADVDRSVHEIRKSLKRVRSILRLVRYSIGESAYRFENSALRDVAQPLSAIRDAKVLCDSLAGLRGRLEESGLDKIYEQAAALLATRRQRAHCELLIVDNPLQTTREQLEAARQRVKDWACAPMQWRALRQGIKRVYRRGRKAYRQAQVDPTVGNLHEWRKQAKYLRYQLEVLTPKSPELIGPLARQAEELGDLLGQDHDLAVLTHVLVEEGRGELEPRALDSLNALIDDRRVGLRDDAMSRGERLYRDPPKQFARQLKHCCR